MLLPGVTVAQSEAATVDLFVCSELCMDGLGAPLSQFSGGPLVELIGFHVSRLQFQLLHPGGAKIGVSSTSSHFSQGGGCNPKWGV